MLISKSELSGQIAEIAGIDKDAAAAVLNHIIKKLFVGSPINQAKRLNDAIGILRACSLKNGCTKRSNPFTQKRLGLALMAGSGAADTTNAWSMMASHRAKGKGGYVMTDGIWGNVAAGKLQEFNSGVADGHKIDLKQSFVVFIP